MVSTNISELIECFRRAKRTLVLLDYDGTLVNYEPFPGDAKMSDRVVEILNRIIQRPDTDLFIISGRAHIDFDNLVKPLQINIIAEHGSMIKAGNRWESMLPENQLWKDSVIPFLRQAASKCPGSFVEEKRFSLAWHYRNADPRKGMAHSRQLILNLDKFIHSLNLKILDGNKVVEIMPAETGKGKAVKKLLRQGSYDFILAIGDDVTDEEIFEYFSNISNTFTIKVGNGKSFARFNLGGIEEVVSLLKILSE